MVTLKAPNEEVIKDFPFVQEWINTITEKIMGKNPANEEQPKVEFFYSYGFFLPKIENEEDKIKSYTDLQQKYFEMLFPERLQHELSKIRIEIGIKIGSTFMMSNRLPKDNLNIPKVIKDSVTEIVKIKMMMESRFHENQDVKDSIPPIDESIVKIKIDKDLSNNEEEETYDIDSILDKISKNGIDSLSEKEKEFLNKTSKGI